MTWPIPLIAAAIALLTLFLSKPERKKLAWVTALVIVSYGTWQARGDYSDERTKVELQRRVYTKLSGGTNSFLDVLSAMIISSSDGWLPQNEEEFFSPRVARMLCSQLNTKKETDLASHRSFDRWFSESAKRYRQILVSMLAEHSSALDADFVKAISDVERSVLLQIGEQRQDVLVTQQRWQEQHGIESPPLLCWGLDPLVEDSLVSLRQLFMQVEEGAERFQITRDRDWLKFPDHYERRFLGTHRFSPEDLKKWQAAHPKSAGPAMFGAGDPSKGDVLDPRSRRPE